MQQTKRITDLKQHMGKDGGKNQSETIFPIDKNLGLPFKLLFFGTQFYKIYKAET